MHLNVNGEMQNRVVTLQHQNTCTSPMASQFKLSPLASIRLFD